MLWHLAATSLVWDDLGQQRVRSLLDRIAVRRSPLSPRRRPGP